jgi:heme exporter protein C
MDRLQRILGWLAFVLIVIALGAIFLYAPTAIWEGKPWPSQRIFYFHVPSAWTTFLAVLVVFAASVMYLWKRDRKWDIVALSSAELAVIFGALVLVTGPLWGRPTWGTFWTWDARLTTYLVMWLIYVGYMMLRAYTEPGEQRARYAAVLGIVGAVNVPIIYLSVQWWRTLHPEQLIVVAGGPRLDARMVPPLLISLLAFTVLYAFLLVARVRLEHSRDAVERLKQEYS